MWTFREPDRLDRRTRLASSLHSIVGGGAPLYQEDLRAAATAFGPIVTQMYGQGEAPMTITVMPPGKPSNTPAPAAAPSTE
ncbi:hypothetical protein D5S19_03110 [Amycolatopsis panacis]|uniref:Uncharacterized protein n=1 Tax=Amycolatopsis panacis TaxID=2340917 RepID=A0A419IAR2_9PSEU|nr:hypothetical protein D5S19_03110 [Amycolatopsis panacis]